MRTMAPSSTGPLPLGSHLGTSHPKPGYVVAQVSYLEPMRKFLANYKIPYMNGEMNGEEMLYQEAKA